jgi:LAGLIDADG endonuclease
LRSREDGIWYYEVNNFNSIIENVIPFFRKYGFLSAKKKNDFAKFQQVAELIKEKKHLTKEGIEKILLLRDQMNNGGKHKFTSDFILKKLNESSETIRQTEIESSDDIVRTS